jgi:hypothetical protein
MDEEPLLIRQISRIALRALLKSSHPATARSGPHPSDGEPRHEPRGKARPAGLIVVGRAEALLEEASYSFRQAPNLRIASTNHHSIQVT